MQRGFGILNFRLSLRAPEGLAGFPDDLDIIMFQAHFREADKQSDPSEPSRVAGEDLVDFPRARA